jgi:hypothetical protein
MPRIHRCVLLAVLISACDSKITSETIDPAFDDPVLKEQIKVVAQCFPQLYAKAQALLDLAEAWRMNTNGSIPDPAGLGHAGAGPIDVEYAVNGCVITMSIRFYDPAGNPQDGIANSSTTLADKIDEAATHLRDTFGAGCFMVGDWTIDGVKGGAAISGGGALTGLIGGATNQNELEELRTTTATPAAGPPPNADNVVQEDDCTLTFNTAGLLTDEQPTQEYPIGTITVALDGPEADSATDVTAVLTFDGSAVVTIAINGVDRLTYDIATRRITAIAP